MAAPTPVRPGEGAGAAPGKLVRGGSEVDWDRKESRERFLGELVAGARRVLELAGVVRGRLESGSRRNQELAQASHVPEAIVLQDVEVNREEEGGPPRARIKQETTRHRICSVTDPEIRHGRNSSSKGFDGHKLSLAADVETQLITAVAVLPGSAPDDQGALDMVRAPGAAMGIPSERLRAPARARGCSPRQLWPLQHETPAKRPASGCTARTPLRNPGLTLQPVPAPMLTTPHDPPQRYHSDAGPSPNATYSGTPSYRWLSNGASLHE